MTEPATLTPTVLLARELRAQHEAAMRAEGRRSWPTRQVLPLSAWLRARVAEAGTKSILLNRSQAQLLWEEAIMASPESAHLLDIRGAASIASDAWTLLRQWQVPADPLRFSETDDAAAFLGWMRTFDRKTAGSSWIDPARVAEVAAGLLADPPAALTFAGFDETPPQINRLAAAFEAAGTRVDSWSAPALSPRSIRRARCADASHELYAAAEWARTRVNELPPGARIAVVMTPDRMASARRIFTDVLCPGVRRFDSPSGSLPFRIAQGQLLIETPLVKTAMHAIALQQGALPLEELGSLIRSPFLGAAMSERSHRAIVDATLRRPHPSRVTLEQAVTAARLHAPQLARLLDKVAEVRRRSPNRANPSQWSGHFTRLLRAVEWPGRDALSETEAAAFSAWDELLSEFASLDGLTGGPLTAVEASVLLERLAGEKAFELEDRGEPIQLLDIEETRGLTFDALWICGMTADAWPRPPAPNPFLPLSLQRQYNLPRHSSRRELDWAIRTSHRLLHSAAEAVVSHAQQDHERMLRPSPLFEELPEFVPGAQPALWRSAALESLEDEHAPALASGLIEKGGTRILELQAQCPFRAFAEIRLGAQPLESAASGLNPRDRGSLLHLVLEKVWDRLGSHAELIRRSTQELTEIVDDAIEQALQHRFHKHALDDPFEREVRRIEAARIRAQMLRWLAFEATRAPFTVLQREQELRVTVGSLQFQARIDRIDRLAAPQSGDVILDYKTGAVSVEDWEGARPGAPQLPVYLLAHPHKVAGLAFARISAAEECRFEGYTTATGVLPDVPAGNLEAMKLEWRRVFAALADEYLSGDARVDPKSYPETCQYCRLGAACRVAP